MTASSTVLNVEQVSGAAVITSAAVIDSSVFCSSCSTMDIDSWSRTAGPTSPAASIIPNRTHAGETGRRSAVPGRTNVPPQDRTSRAELEFPVSRGTASRLHDRYLIVCPDTRDDPLEVGRPDRFASSGESAESRPTRRRSMRCQPHTTCGYPEDMVRASRSDVGRRTGRRRRFDRCVESSRTMRRAKPLPFAAWVFGIGFILGWKMKPW